MNRRLAAIIGALVFNSLSLQGQLVEGPLFSFEHLSWGMHPQVAERILGDQSLQASSLPSNSLAKESGGMFSTYFLDKMYAAKVLIALQFSMEDSSLQRVIVCCAAIDSTDGSDRTSKIKLERLGESYSERLGKTKSSKSIPFVGKVKNWSLKNSDVQMLYLSAVASVTIVFAPPSKEE